MGGNQTCPVNGTAPVLDRFKTLTTGKWYLKPYVQESLNNPNGDCAACNLDDYIIFRTNGTCDWTDGGVKCGDHEGGIDYAYNIPWKFKNNQTVISFTSEFGDVTDWPILEMSDSTMSLDGVKLAHGN
jgi:hypothetical protein